MTDGEYELSDSNFGIALVGSSADAVSPSDAEAFAEDVCDLALEHGIDFKEARPVRVSDQ